MDKTNVQADSYGIQFNLPSASTYVIGWWQIERDGYSYWLSHLQEKSWFTEDMRRKFEALCFDHYNWYYYTNI